MKRNLIKIAGVFMLLMVAALYSCKKDILKISTTTDVNITGYIENNPETFSLLLQIMERSKTQGYLGAYGTYTLFAPTNSAIQAWITESKKTSLADFSDDELLSFMKYHVIRDTVSTVRFVDGKIRTPTLFGEFLYTDVVNGVYRVNKESLLSKSNVVCGNGVVHHIDKILTPPSKSLAQLIEANPRYTIFTEALKATGFYDTLNYQRGDVVSKEKRFQTVILHSDSLFNQMGITSIDGLKARYSTKGNPKDHTDSLWLYVAYHIMNDGLYLQDIASSASLYTLAPKEIITTKFEGTRILLNETLFNNVLEPGAEIDRKYSDNLAINGVFHEAKDNFYIKVRKQEAVYWQLGSEPETVSALGSSYRNATRALIANSASISAAIRVDDPTKAQAGQTFYDYWGTAEARRPRAGGDYVAVNMCSANSARLKWIEFKTPYLVKGRYKVWVCYVQQGNAANLQVSFDHGTAQEQVLPNLVYVTQTLGATAVDLAAANSDNLMLAQGYKRYMATTVEVNKNGVRGLKPVSGSDAAFNVGRLAGIINVETTDRHTLRFTAISEGRCLSNNTTWLDMVHFIPADDNEQNYPRFHVNPSETFLRP